MNAKKKAKRPVSRHFWSLLKFLPKSLRAKFIRSRFEVQLELPPEFIFKQAETAEEIQQAFKLVHDSYVELDYMDPNDAKMRFSKFHTLPTTVILIAKWNDEVIGTISILPDSWMGLPSDTTWNLNKYRSNGQLIAEISSLCIRKDLRGKRGHLLMPLCKAMLRYCTEILKLDGIVIATTVEVEPFYTDILQFQKVTEKTGQKHSLVKNNPSTCCYLNVQSDLEKTYQKIYSGKPKNRDLHYFFFALDLPNIKLPKPRLCIQSYMTLQTSSLSEILENHGSLVSELTEIDKQVVRNLDIAGSLATSHFIKPRAGKPRNFREPRPEVRSDGWCFLDAENPNRCRVMDVSKSGFRIQLKNNNARVKQGDKLILIHKFQGQIIPCKAEIKWIQSNVSLGCQILQPSQDWNEMLDQIVIEARGQSNTECLPTREAG